MTESLDAAVARIDATLDAVRERMAENYAITKESREEVKQSLLGINETLKTLTKISDEWSGVRRAIIAAGALITLLSAILGTIFGYLRFGQK